MILDVKVPGVGESVQEGMISSWRKSHGDQVLRDDVICELETDKATVELAAESAGILEILVPAQTVVRVGDVIGKIIGIADTIAGHKVQGEPLPLAPSVQLPLAPSVQRLAAETSVDPTVLQGTGKGGRVTKGDMLSAAAALSKTSTSDLPQEVTPSKIPIPSGTPKVSVPASPSRETTKKPLSMLRRRIAQRLIAAQQNSAILTTFNEVDMTAVIHLRKTYKDLFEEKHGIKMGFMGFFVKASVAALETYPNVNAYLEADEVCYHNYCDVGVAVSTDKGLLVPVIRDVHRLSLWEIEGEIGRFAKKARDQKISLDDLEGGTFTVSNGGVFGSLLSTPILNPPQTGILGMHKTQMRPVVMDGGKIEARPMMYLALSYDHRLIDGKEAVGFLIKIKEGIEDPTRLLLGV
jgi:2-oxoglutarate dehydrogenase E2 component (dihydrolipoamide succinyltransferase)